MLVACEIAQSGTHLQMTTPPNRQQQRQQQQQQQQHGHGHQPHHGCCCRCHSPLVSASAAAGATLPPHCHHHPAADCHHDRLRYQGTAINHQQLVKSTAPVYKRGQTHASHGVIEVGMLHSQSRSCDSHFLRQARLRVGRRSCVLHTHFFSTFSVVLQSCLRPAHSRLFFF